MSPVTGTVSAEQAGRRVEEILDRLAAGGDERACSAAEELVRVLMDFYGAGLARTVELLARPADAEPAEGRPPAPLAGLLGDELVSGLLVLHDLHPEDVPTRIARALRGVRHSLESAGYDESTGVLRLRLTGSTGCGCPSTQEVARQAAVEALACFAPEVTAVELHPVTREPALLQIGAGPPGGGSAAGRAPATAT
ncbi:hypothetical protein [Streptomyces marianii]|uniref:NifU family protein n=1 Tax=Streptomyces marianii TaxID=1817406 RepID=A0A5R9EBX9_9ACTN|nr:hypothetical protein [Streptomyces marianii]TLQ47476.1 hypothetical protein FEF34_35075 [Streptomyces marianii]